MQGSGTILLFRFIHIVVGAFWFGAVIFMTVFLMPSLQAAGPAAGAVMDQLTRVRRLPIYMMSAAILTILSGFALYARDSGGFSGPWMRSGTGMVFGIGGLAGTLGAVVGMAVATPAGRRMGVLGAEIKASGGAPTPVQVAELQALQSRIARGSLAVAVLIVIATMAMSLARYVP
jgi:uncharacterized membrane protein